MDIIILIPIISMGMAFVRGMYYVAYGDRREQYAKKNRPCKRKKGE